MATAISKEEDMNKGPPYSRISQLPEHLSILTEEDNEMSDDQGRIPGVEFDIETKSHRLKHRKGAVASAIVYLYTFVESESYRQWARIRIREVTMEQLEVLQFLQKEFARATLTTEGDDPNEIHE